MGLPLIRPTRAAAPAVEPKSIDPALRYSNALLEPSVWTNRIAMPSLANSFSSRPFSFRTMETGLYVAQSIRISRGASAARTTGAGASPARMPNNRQMREMIVTDVLPGFDRHVDSRVLIATLFQALGPDLGCCLIGRPASSTHPVRTAIKRPSHHLVRSCLRAPLRAECAPT